ncbi:FtsW/RodA/SpoVE family cell cycle protein [Clavibacter capsici]|uniref:FtsW/RodA/SpoVE family cell cycle protein n=1 Tax=Clavibacter capsici TaxID=1874630 RepID=A0AAE7CAI6_9MICO|nr:FtsW/RodA/SpoVE family cell cycle protein [Clavibacter capsici]QIS43618.1 FtsW/RodA/SpoVE family cell cycle protein [Clavibacter capsici]
MASAGVADAPARGRERAPKVPRIRVPRRLRNLELALVVLASVINGGALYLVQLGALGAFDRSFFLPATGLAVLVLGMHVALRWLAPDADPFILPIATVLNGLGIAAIYRLDLAGGYSGWDSVAVRQIVWSGLAIVCALAVIVLLKNHRVLQRYRYIAMFVGLILLLLPMLPFIGQNINGARVWIHIGGFSFQPGEIAKICLAIFFAGYLVTARDSLSMVGVKVLGMRFPRVRDLGPILLVWAVSMSVLVFQRDLGTSLLYFGLFIVMTYVSTGRIGWVVLGAVLFLGGAFGASTLGYVGGRVDAWLNPFDPAVYDAQGGSFQLVTGLFGMASGGLFGQGLGSGMPALTPLANSDFILASLGEELGLTGVFAILALYLLLVSRGFRIGFAGQDDFGKLLGIGLSFVIALQVFIVIGGVTRVIPLTGLTTPFMAAGGSSLLANWIIAALLLRLSDTVRNQPRLVVES